MTQNSMNTPYAKRVAEKFRDAQNYLKTNGFSRNFLMTQTSMNTPYAKRVAEKFREAQNYLKTNGFSRSTKHLLEDIENSVEK